MHVILRVTKTEAAPSGVGIVELTIEDDGVGQSNEVKGELGFGLGLVGIRERVLALDGQMSVHAMPNKGLVLSVRIPAPTIPDTAPEGAV